MFNSYNNQKIFNIILGAGFSKAIANLPLTQEIDEEIFELNNESSESSKLYKYLKSKDQNTNFEDIIYKFQSLSASKDLFDFCSTNEPIYLPEINNNSPQKDIEMHAAFYSKIKSLSNRFSEKLKTILSKKLLIKSDQLSEDLAKKFIGFLNALISDGFIIQIYDLNYDNVFEELINSSEIKEQYLDFFNVEKDDDLHFNFIQFKLYKKVLENNYLKLIQESNNENALRSFHQIEYRDFIRSIKKNFNDFNNINTKKLYCDTHNKKIVHLKLHGSISFNRYDHENKELLFPIKVSNLDRINKMPFILTGGNKFKWLNDPYTAMLFNLINKNKETLTIGYSFNPNDIHINSSFGIVNNGQNFPIDYFPEDRNHSDSYDLSRLCNRKSLENKHKTFYLNDFLNNFEQHIVNEKDDYNKSKNDLSKQVKRLLS